MDFGFLFLFFQPFFQFSVFLSELFLFAFFTINSFPVSSFFVIFAR